MSLMNFDELVPGATVRFTQIDGVQYLSVRDLIMVVCVKTPNDACDTWADMSQEKKNELTDFLRAFKFPGRGQQTTPVITFPGAIKLMMWLPGEHAKNARTKAAEILTRYFAGDKSLLTEIEANAASDAPVNQMARAALVTKTTGTELEAQTLKKLKLDNMSTFVGLMDSIRPTWRADQRLVLKTEDSLKNAMFDEPLAITNGPGASVSISQVVHEMGIRPLGHGDACKVGRAVAAAYRERYGVSPPSHKQWVDGAEREVKSYTERDRDLIEDALNGY